MSLEEELPVGVDQILSSPWHIRGGEKVPSSEEVLLGGGAVQLEVTVLYTDLADSTRLVTDFDPRVAAKVLKAFLYCATKLIRHKGGDIRSFDGDRVMGIFIGDSKNTSAANAALHINWAVSEVIRPALAKQYPTLAEAGFRLRHATGVDRSKILAVRAGIRGSNDLLWIGRAGAVAAKLSALRDGNYTSYVTADVYNNMAEGAKLSTKPGTPNMWDKMATAKYGLTIYRSTWWRSP